MMMLGECDNMKVNRKSGVSVFILFNVLAVLVFSSLGAVSITAYAADAQYMFTGKNVDATTDEEVDISFNLTDVFFQKTENKVINSFKVKVTYNDLVPVYDDFIHGYFQKQKSKLDYSCLFENNNTVYIYYSTQNIMNGQGNPEKFLEKQDDIFSLRFSVPKTKSNSINVDINVESVTTDDGAYITQLKKDYSIEPKSTIKVNVKSVDKQSEKDESSQKSDESDETNSDDKQNSSSTTPNDDEDDDDGSAALNIVGFTGLACVIALSVILIILCNNYVDLYKGIECEFGTKNSSNR